jgi:hypothetical protein
MKVELHDKVRVINLIDSDRLKPSTSIYSVDITIRKLGVEGNVIDVKSSQNFQLVWIDQGTDRAGVYTSNEVELINNQS